MNIKKHPTHNEIKQIFGEFEQFNLLGIRWKTKNPNSNLILELNKKLVEMGFNNIEVSNLKVSKRKRCPQGAEPIPVYNSQGVIIGFDCPHK